MMLENVTFLYSVLPNCLRFLSGLLGGNHHQRGLYQLGKKRTQLILQSAEEGNLSQKNTQIVDKVPNIRKTPFPRILHRYFSFLLPLILEKIQHSLVYQSTQIKKIKLEAHPCLLKRPPKTIT